MLGPFPRQTVLVVGLGRSGVSACRFLRRLGCRVRATECAESSPLLSLAASLSLDGVTVELGGHTEPFCEGSDWVVVSPGVPETAIPLAWAARRRIPVISELELGARHCRGRVVAITGSNGKSTVSAWVGAMLETAERPVVVAGNIGTPLTDHVATIRPGTTVVLEVSSFQLERVERFRPFIACVVNVTPNHLDRHPGFSAYVAAKRRLLTQQRFLDWAVLNADDPVCQSLRPSVRGRMLEFSLQRPVRGAYVAGHALMLVLRARRHRVAPVGDVQLLGAHNVANALAAVTIGGILGLEPAVMAEAIRQFRGLPHRLERVARWQGITFINDSKSTTVEAGIKALEAVPGRVVLIAGGKDKGSGFAPLRDVAARTARAAVLIGVDAARMAEALAGVIPTIFARTMPEAVQTAARLARPGESVLLSPMCTSFDMFRDFEDRGDQFRGAVEALVTLERDPAAVEAR